MKLSRLLQSIRDPPPESMVGLMTRADGRVMRHMPFVILFNLAWVFFWPIIADQPFLRVILPTLLSVPLFVKLSGSLMWVSTGCISPSPNRLVDPSPGTRPEAPRPRAAPARPG